MTSRIVITRVLIAFESCCKFKSEILKNHHEVLHHCCFAGRCCKLSWKKYLCNSESVSASELNINRFIRIYLDRLQLNTLSRLVTTWTSPAKNAFLNTRFQPPTSKITRRASSTQRVQLPAIFVASLPDSDSSTWRPDTSSTTTWFNSARETQPNFALASLAASTTPAPKTPACGLTVASSASRRADTCQKDIKSSSASLHFFLQCLTIFFCVLNFSLQ